MMRWLCSVLAATAVMIPHAAAIEAGEIIGRASVVDGDTLDIHGARVRLRGIDAPEADQLCRGDDTAVGPQPAEEKIREADQLECEAWNEGGPAMPSPGEPQAEPTIGKAINGGYDLLEAKCVTGFRWSPCDL